MKLLRVLQEGEYEVVEEEVRKTNARIISATNRKLEELIEAKISHSFIIESMYRLRTAALKERQKMCRQNCF